MTTDIPDWEDPRRVLGRHGLAPKRGFSQNFLVSRSAVERIADALELSPGELVVELGALLRAGGRVIAIDADRDMLEVLDKELGGVAMLSARYGDAAQVDLAELTQGVPVKVAGNLPYAVTGAIFRRLVDQPALVKRAVLMVQKEVRDRLVAAPGGKDYGALTVFTHAAFDVRPVCIVPAGAFFPPPKVDSAVVSMTPARHPVDANHAGFVRAVRCAFEARRKTLRNALQRGFEVAHVDGALTATAIDGQRRGETLSVQEFFALGEALLAGSS
jgi:16S rRNA (adenine1518-N6/adenine1519-N6)-dimethyltransferase